MHMWSNESLSKAKPTLRTREERINGATDEMKNAIKPTLMLKYNLGLTCACGFSRTNWF